MVRGLAERFGRRRFSGAHIYRLLAAGSVAMLVAAVPSGARTMMETAKAITVTTVVDNYAIDRRLTTRWGFAAVVSTPSTTILFDTGGDGATLLANMAKLRIEPGGIHQVVISHIHSDHLGGLGEFLRNNAKVRVFIPHSFPDQVRRMIDAAGAGHQDVSTPTRIAPGIHTTGLLGASLQEQALVVETEEGPIIITGCAHPGIVAIVQKVRALMPNPDIALVMGGFHLMSASLGEIGKIVQSLRKLGVRRVAPSHCTGDPARHQFKEAYGADYIEGGAGMILKFVATKAPPR
jgi:7,8-dihydropterin-6-yl-methyl-4-(beta-D-ribofuranosyl)aminobenzene 5'-phosphate synthase